MKTNRRGTSLSRPAVDSRHLCSLPLRLDGLPATPLLCKEWSAPPRPLIPAGKKESKTQGKKEKYGEIARRRRQPYLSNRWNIADSSVYAFFLSLYDHHAGVPTEYPMPRLRQTPHGASLSARHVAYIKNSELKVVAHEGRYAKERRIGCGGDHVPWKTGMRRFRLLSSGQLSKMGKVLMLEVLPYLERARADSEGPTRRWRGLPPCCAMPRESDQTMGMNITG